MRKIKRLFGRKIFTMVVFPALLLMFWFSASLLMNNRISFSVLEFSNDEAVISGKNNGRLFKGSRIVGEFKANDNHLGIVLLRFKNFVKPDFRGEDVLTFSLREKGSDKWYYTNNYRSGLVERSLLFPFGFPPINNSKSKTYQFELKSLYGNTRNAVELDYEGESLKSAYQYPRQEIMGSKLRLINFTIIKVLNSFTNVNFLLSSVIYFLPFAFYLLWLYMAYLKTDFSKKYLALTILFFIILDIFFIKEFYSGVFLGLIIGWIFCIKFYKLSGNHSLVLAFLFIMIWIILMGLRIDSFSQKLNMWTYGFLAIGVLSIFFELKKR